MLWHQSDLEKPKEMLHLDWATGCLHHPGEIRVFKMQIYWMLKRYMNSRNRLYCHDFVGRGSRIHTNFAALWEHSSVLTYETKSAGYSPGEIREPVDYTTCS